MVNWFSALYFACFDSHKLKLGKLLEILQPGNGGAFLQVTELRFIIMNGDLCGCVCASMRVPSPNNNRAYTQPQLLSVCSVHNCHAVHHFTGYNPKSWIIIHCHDIDSSLPYKYYVYNGLSALSLESGHSSFTNRGVFFYLSFPSHQVQLHDSILHVLIFYLLTQKVDITVYSWLTKRNWLLIPHNFFLVPLLRSVLGWLYVLNTHLWQERVYARAHTVRI
jgi:hypothetical protein